MIQLSLRRTPIFIDFHEDLQIDRFPKELLQCLTRLRTHLLQGHTLMTDDDTLLTVTFHIDDGIDMNMLLVFLEALYADFHGIGNLLVVIQEDLLPDNL